MQVIKKSHHIVRKSVKKLHRFANRFWFPPLLLVFALFDVFVIFIPTDSILISSSMLMKKRWMPFALSVAVGSSIGALLLVNLVEFHGLQKLLEFYPGVDQTNVWKWTLNFFNEYGIWVVFLVGLTPFSQQPILIIAALSDISFFSLGLMVFIGRIIKFCIMAYIASHVPHFLNKLWGLKSEVKDAGIKID